MESDKLLPVTKLELSWDTVGSLYPPQYQSLGGNITEKSGEQESYYRMSD